MPSTPVTGTVSVSNFPATQPVSGTVTANSTLQAGTNYVGKVRLTDGTNDATLRSLTSSKSLDVSIVDGTGSQITSFGGGTQYADGATQATPTGTVALGKNATNILHALSLDSSGNLNVNLAAGSITGGNAAASATGSAVPTSADYIGGKDALGNLRGASVLGLTNSNALAVEIVDADGSQITSFGGGTQYTNGSVQATPTGTVALGWDGSNVRVLSTNASGALKIAQLPSSAALADGSSNPTTTQIGANMLGYDGISSWYRINSTNAAADALGSSGVGLINDTRPRVYNGSTWDRQRDISTANNTTGSGVLSVGAAGQYNSTPPTITSGNYNVAQLDVNGNAKDTLATLIAGEDLTNNVLKVEERFSYGNVVAAAATTTKSGAGFVHTVTINNPTALASATTATTIKIFDNTAGSGTLIGTISLPLSANLTTALPFTIRLDASFATGLTTLVTLGTSGVWTPDMTITYR